MSIFFDKEGCGNQKVASKKLPTRKINILNKKRDIRKGV